MINIELFADKENITEDDISEVAICLDNEGIEELCKKLQYLKMVIGPEHIHLATEQWGGAGLSSKKSGSPEYILVNQLRIVKIK